MVMINIKEAIGLKKKFNPIEVYKKGERALKVGKYPVVR